MSKKISELDIATEANNEDILILNQEDETKQISKEDLFSDTDASITQLEEDLKTRTDEMIGVEEYSDSVDYDVGEYCIHENKLYICVTAVTAEVWDSTKWEQTSVINRIEEEDITSQCTFNESYGVNNTQIVRKGNMIFVAYQGESKTHTSSPNSLLFTVPSKYKPKYNKFAPFTKNVSVYGTLAVRSATGNVEVNSISSTTTAGRVYANFSYSFI